MGPGHADGLAARRPRAARRRADLLRRRLQPADPQPVARRARRSSTRPHKVARLLFAYTHRDPPLLAASQGNMQTLPDGNALVGYGGVPAISEYARGGSLLFDAHMPFDMSFYRAFRFPWQGRPLTPPAVRGEPQQHRRRDDRPRQLERRHRRGRLARARRLGARLAEGRQRDPLAGLRELAHASQALRLRAGPGARRLRHGRSELAAPSRWAATPPRCRGADAEAARLERRLGRRVCGVLSWSCVVVVGVVVGVLVVEELLFPPQAASTKVLASAARSVSMAVSGNLRIGRAPIVARGLGRPPYQAPPAPPAARTRCDERRDRRHPEGAGAAPGERRAERPPRGGCWPSAAWPSSWSSST